MTDVIRVAPEDFDWTAGAGPAAAVRRVVQAATAEDGADALNEQAVLRLKNRGLRDSELWLADDVGFALRQGDDLDLAVDPSARRQGVGTALAGAALAPGRRVDAWSHADHPGAARLAARFGVPRERELLVMRRSLSSPLPAVSVPVGVRIRTFEPGDEQALLEVNAAAFAHHPEQGHLTLEDLRERMGEEWFSPAGLFLAVPSSASSSSSSSSASASSASSSSSSSSMASSSEGPLLGFHWTKVHASASPPHGEVYVVAVNPKAAGRGLGTVLTTVGLQHLRDLGLGSVVLYVDGDNAPAIALYRGLGFEVERVEAQYRGVPEV